MVAYDEAVKGLFLLILAISGNYVAETFGCQTRRLLSNNQYAKHIMTFIILFFSIDFVSGVSNKPASPFDNLKMTGIIYLLFILFTRMNLFFTVLAFLLLMGVYFVMSYHNYAGKVGGTSEQEAMLGTVRRALTVLLVGTIALGAVQYFMNQRKEHRRGWNTLKYFFGSVKCDH